MSDHALPGWLDGQQPERFNDRTFIARQSLVARSTLTDAQVTELVRTGRLTPHGYGANKRITAFHLDEVNALFEPVPVNEA